MAQEHSTFGELFKKYRLRSEFSTLSQFGNALAQEGYIYEDSIYSHWQKNVRVPKDRKLLLALIKIFIEKGGITTTVAANSFLNSAGQGYLTKEELEMVTKNTSLVGNAITPANALSFLLTTIQSKGIIRTGWQMMSIPEPESVAEHSFQLCVIAMVFADQLGVDREKLIKMAIIHDLGEIFTGDIVWSRGNIIDIKKRQEKEVVESQGIEALFTKLGNLKEYQDIFLEMTERKSIEASIFWQLDKLEMAIQALKYEQDTGINLDEFFVTTDLQLTLPFLRDIFSHALAQRPLKKRI
ncbi:MAG: HD domain-containing protein [Candidatus Roizmanbacteria bacterium]|nr:HD domain-containing protein [Candidatus Roizmanbacteria bacterium]